MCIEPAMKGLRWIKEWICSERPITICAIVKACLCQGSRICLKGDVTRRQRPMRALTYFTEQRNLRANKRRTRLLDYSPQLACLGWPSAGFISICVYLSKERTRKSPWLSVELNKRQGSPDSLVVRPLPRTSNKRTGRFLWHSLELT